MNALNEGGENSPQTWIEILGNEAELYADMVRARMEALTIQETFATIRKMGEVTGIVQKDGDYTYIDYQGTQFIDDPRTANAIHPSSLTDGMSVKFKAQSSREYGIIAIITGLVIPK